MHTHYRLALALASMAALLVALAASRPGRRLRLERLIPALIAAIAAGNFLFAAFLWCQHLRFPLALELMEPSILQHVLRILRHEPVYAAAQPGFVPFAYNPLYYFAALPMVRLLGPNLLALRLLAVLGAAGAALVLHVAVSGWTGSRWWGLVAAGLFAAAYRAMDCYVDTAHADSLMLLAALLGTWLIHRRRSPLWDAAGLLVLIAAFWFKQHGAFFALGGASYLTWRDGWRRSWGYWAALLLLGPALYVLAGPALFGPEFHFYTWHVPRLWSRLDAGTFARLLAFFGRWYAMPLAAAAYLCLRHAATGGRRWSAWHFQLGAAVLTACQGALDADSSDNVFIPLGTWALLAGAMGLHAYATRPGRPRGPLLAHLAVLFSFAALAYPPRDVLTPPQAGARYAELADLLRGLPGAVYTPDVGPLPGAPPPALAAHWVALDDLTRGDARDSLRVETVLAPALHPTGSAWLLTYRRLVDYPCLRSLRPCYVLDADLGDRFLALRPLPRRFRIGWPRFLYRYDPAAAQAGAGAARARPAERRGVPTPRVGLDFAGGRPHPPAP